MKKYTIFFSIFLIVLLYSSCNQTERSQRVANRLDELMENQNDQSNELLAINASQYGVKYPETFVLMQNRMGIRIEYCIDRGRLQLWISPQAGKSYSYVDKNWSNRDDFTAIFDRIVFPELNLNNFDSCDFDPFHSILYFKEQVLHISQVYDQPCVIVWFDKPGLVDIKINGDEVEREDHSFIFNHRSRGRDFQSAAVMGKGEGKFQHQMVLDDFRSVHTRAHLSPGQPLFISSEIEEEQIGVITKEIAKNPVIDILKSNETMIQRDLDHGRFYIKDRHEMQKLLDKSRRVALSMQDFKGFMRSTNQYIYYLLWYRDGGMNTGHITYTGWVDPVKDHTKMALINPNVSYEDPEGVFFGQLMAGPITKWEEDGLFFVVWPAFAYWTQTGDDTYCKGKYLETMEMALDWLERRCFDEEKGLFGRYHFCETPLTNSRGDGYDQATGAPTFRWGSDYEGETIVRSYDMYINALNYAVYMMLAAMESGEKAQEYLNKATQLEANMRKFFEYDDPLPSYGDLLTINNKMVVAEPYGMDRTDFRWSVSIPPFVPNNPEKYREVRNQLVKDLLESPKGAFLCAYNAILTSMDPLIHNEDTIMMAMDYLVPQSIRPGKYLPMPYAMPEIVDMEDGNPFHDVRPLVYSIAPWLSAVTNLGIRRLPFGIAVRGTKYLDSLVNYEYKHALMDIEFEGEGEIEEVLINGEELKHSYQIPENELKLGDNLIQIKMSEVAQQQKSNLVSSTTRLASIRFDGNILYQVEAFGQNILTFKDLSHDLMIKDETGREIESITTLMNDLTYVEFEGRGKYLVELVER